MKDIENLIQQREEEYHDTHKQVEGIWRVLKELKKHINEKSFTITWKKDLRKFIEKKEKDCDLMLEVCKRNIKAATGPMSDRNVKNDT